MAITATPVPHFSGKNELSLQDLDALATAVRAHTLTSEYVPAGEHRGRRQYTGANYNLSQFVDECNGETATPDKPGIISSVQYRSTAAPYIDNGNMVLPLAHDWDPAEDSSVPAEQATGGICSINVRDGLKRACIHRGSIQLPLAHSDWDGAEGAMSTPGLVYGVEIHDNCEGAIAAPYIEQGIIHLPAPTGGGGSEDDDCPGTCSCPLAQADGPNYTAGLICGVDYHNDPSWGNAIVDGRIRLQKANRGNVGGVGTVRVVSPVECSEPEFVSGELLLPQADTCCDGIVAGYPGGLVKNVVRENGKEPYIAQGCICLPYAVDSVVPHDAPYECGCGVHLADLEGCSWCPVTMSICTLPDGTTLYLDAWTQCGGLCLRLSTNSYYSY